MILDNIFAQTRHEIDQYKSGTIKIADNYTFSSSKLINKITLYINSKFETGQKDGRGRRKFFYNISLFRRDTTKRLIDVDVKHFRFFSKNTTNQLKALFLEYSFKNWAKDNDFGMLLNDMAEQVATYGTAFLKTTIKLIPSVVDIRKIFFDQGAENVQKSRYIIEEHLLTPAELEEKKADGWLNTDKLIERWMESDEEFIKVYERQGIVPESWIKKGGKKTKFIKGLFIIADIENYEETKTTTIENGLILFKQELDEYSYYDFSIRKQKGRLLGMGDIELLLDAQIRRNELANQKAVAMEISSKHLFMTPDDTISGNFLSDYLDGTILKGSLTPVATENRDLSSWANEEKVWDVLADRLTFSFDVIRGEAIASSTPATNALIQEKQAMSNFALIRQNFGLFWERFVEKFLMPKLIKNFNGKDILRVITDNLDDLEQVDALLIEEFKKSFKYSNLLKTSFSPEENEVADFERGLKKEFAGGGLVRVVNHAKEYFKGFEYQIMVNVVNEKIDPTTEIINLQNFIGQIANPQVLQDPILRKFIYKIAEKIGVPISDIQRIEETKSIQQTQVSQQMKPQIIQSTPEMSAINK